ncbi:GMC family oxidoreductase [Thalassotalea mangrovi]|uniref:GMC family oxidoreductase n=1 Tax=Thalassotalea mangrovi TaxID=2572245 RepID=A0A4U1B8D6_9GAMM|nr:GMC family oxidoreductase N-terminal domain-containing protein [Thalassotalea mangrovi]TKB46942.1 GMC family oxidoreductase [Thalassotalea mangrovi]
MDYDFIIIGGGSAGCVLANRLSARSDLKVCLLETGGRNQSPLIKTPLAIPLLFRIPKYNYGYETLVQPSQANRRIYNPRGRGLGGSSAINAMLYIRGDRQDYDDWAAQGNEGWSYDELLPYFKSIEHQQRIEDEYHGQGGELNITDSRSNHPIGQEFIDAALSLGYPFNPDFNGKQQSGIGRYQVTQKNGQRHSAADAFIYPLQQASSRKNLTVLSYSRVEKILFDGERATGVRFQQNQLLESDKDNNKTVELRATKEVIVCAGAIHSPQLLMVSGVGPKEQLDTLQIPIVKALEGVGKNLQDHPDVCLVNQQSRSDLISALPSSLWWLAKHAVEYVRQKRGIFTTSLVETGGFIASKGLDHRPDIQWQFIAGAMDDHGRNLKMYGVQGTTLHTCILRPKSRGEIRLMSADIATPPVIDSKMLTHPDDMALMIEAVKLSRQVLSQPPLSAKNVKEIFPGEQVQSDEQIANFIREKSNNIYHPVGTCKMGNDDMAVVDSTLKVRGLSGLRVIDASIMPTLVSGNTNAPTMMIAAKGADLILADYPEG